MKLRTYPSAKPTLTLSSYLRQNVGLGEGSVGSSRCTSKKKKRRARRKKEMQVPPASNTLSQAFIHPFLQISSTLAISHTREQNTLLARNARIPDKRVLPYIVGFLGCNDADDNENVKKAIGLISKTTTLHVHYTFLYIPFPFLHDYDVKMPNFAFYGGRRQATTIYFSF